MGLAPSELWDMHLWEYNLRVSVFNEKQAENARLDFYRAHTTAALMSHGFVGKLRQADYYLPTEKKAAFVGEDLTDEEIAEIDAWLEAKGKNE